MDAMTDKDKEMEKIKKYLDGHNIFILNNFPYGYSVHKGNMYCQKTLFCNVKTEKEAMKLAMNYIIDNIEG